MPQETRRRRPYAARVPLPERREQLLDAPLAIIDRDGYDGVTVDAIAKQAGVTRPVVYGAYDGLAPLLSALLDRQQQRAVGQLFAALPLDALDALENPDSPGRPGPSPITLVDRGASALHAMVLADPVTWRAILQSPANVPDVVRERIEGDRERVREVVGELVAGVLPGADHEVLSHAVLALLEHFGRLVLAEPDRFPAERLTATARDLIGAWLP